MSHEEDERGFSVEYYVTIGGAFSGPNAEKLEQEAIEILRQAAKDLRELGGIEEPQSLTTDYYSSTHYGVGSLT